MTRRRRKFFRLPWRSAKQIHADVEEELGFHLDMRVDELVALGATPDAARSQAMREFGDIEDARRYIGAVDRDIEAAQRRSDFMRDLWDDIGYSLRKLRAAPAFTLAAIITLALGIGANTAIFSVVNGVLLKPLPFPQADHLVRLRFTQQGHPDAGTPMDLVDNRTRATKFVGFSALEGTTANTIRDNTDPERLVGFLVSPNYFDLLRVPPIAGRFFAEGEDQEGAPNVVVISEQLWRRDFSASPAAIGKTLRINARMFTIIGVAPAAQRYPISAELWMPRKFSARDLNDGSRGARWLGWVARVKDGIPVADASAEVARISEVMEAQFPEDFRDRRAYVSTVQEYMTGSMRKPLLIMLGAVAFVLLIACANVANLMLVRAAARESEMAIRTALGAGRGRLVRQLMTESVLLSLCGGAAGLAVAKVGMQMMLDRAPGPLGMVAATATIDATALAVTALVSVITGLIFGVLPAMHVGKHDLAVALRAGARGARSRPSANRAKQIIVVAEVALAVTLLTGAGLLMHSFAKLMAVDPGFRPEGVLTMKVALPSRNYDTTAQRNFIRAVEQRARALPGVQTVGVANFIPLDGQNYNFTFNIRGRPVARPSDEPSTEVRQVTPDFFTTLGMPVVRGRGVLASDQPGMEKVVVVSQSFATRFFPGADALGQAIHLQWGKDSATMRRVVGVVGDVHGSGLAEPLDPTVYVPIMQAPDDGLSIVVKTSAAPATLAAPLRAIVRELDREVPVYSVQTMDERVTNSIRQQRFYATLLAIFATVALILSAVGLYGVIAYAVSQRTHELGIRVALGAGAARISRMVIGEGITLTAIGVVVGVIGSALAGKLVTSLLFGVSAFDPLTLVAVVTVLGAVAALASWLPARRAARVDPLVAMRGD